MRDGALNQNEAGERVNLKLSGATLITSTKDLEYKFRSLSPVKSRVESSGANHLRLFGLRPRDRELLAG